jgi:hypothetical protein
MSRQIKASDSQFVWSLQPDWVFHHHIDGSCSGFHLYSGTALGLNEASGWVVQSLERCPKSTAQIEALLATEADQAIDSNLRQTLAVTLNSLLTEAQIIKKSASP